MHRLLEIKLIEITLTGHKETKLVALAPTTQKSAHTILTACFESARVRLLAVTKTRYQDY